MQGRWGTRGVGPPVGVSGGTVLSCGGEDEAIVATAGVRGRDAP
jgi:hypothetical protein